MLRNGFHQKVPILFGVFCVGSAISSDKSCISGHGNQMFLYFMPLHHSPCSDFLTVQHLRKNSFSITISRLGLTRSRVRAELPTLMRRCKADRWKRHRNTCRNSGKGTCSLTLKEAFQMLKSSMQSMVSASADLPLHLLSE